MATITQDQHGKTHRLGGIRIPIAIWMLLISLALGLARGLNSDQLIAAVSSGFGSSLGEYALILLPAFVIAFAVRSITTGISEWLAPLAAPFAAAAMMCPDTAYATLGPMANRRKLAVLFGSYAGFKLLVPAGPLIVATGLHASEDRLAFLCLPVFAAAWFAGLAYAALNPLLVDPNEQSGGAGPSIKELLPILLLAGLLGFGALLEGHKSTPAAPIGFLMSPKGALLITALIALLCCPLEIRGRAVESAVNRTAPLLLTIGAASALGAMIVRTLPVDRFAALLTGSGLVLPALFMTTATFKTAKGSSMATFAGMTGIVAALLPRLGVSPAAAVLAMCAGAFVMIAPNDSLYWIVKDDVGDRCAKLTRTLAIGSFVQGIAAFAAVELMSALKLI